MPCTIIDSCLFYKKIEKVQTKQMEFIRTHICLSDFMQCVRYKIRSELGEYYVPLDLSPTGFDQAGEILRNFRKQKQKEKDTSRGQKFKKPSALDFD